MAASLSWLGTPQLIINGYQTELERRKAVALLAYLSLSKTPVSRDVLATLFWSQSEREQAMANLRRVFFVLNRVVPELVRIERKSAEFSPPPNTTIDVILFERQVMDGIKLPIAQRVAALHDALMLYRGDFLEGLTLPDSYAFESWQVQKSAELHALAQEAYRELIAALFQLRRQDAMFQQALLWLALAPQSEEPYRTLMYLHAACGQQHEAIAYYDRCLDMLQKQLETVPEPATLRLYEAIIGHAPLPATGYLPVHTRQTKRKPTTLPMRVEVIGRESQLDQICNQLIDLQRRMLTIKGMGGVGKSVLAIAAAHQLQDKYSDGVFFCDFAAQSANRSLFDILLDALTVKSLSQISAEQQLVAYLKGRHLLLILDNFDHFHSQASHLVRLLQECTYLDLLVTARARLGLRAEWNIQLDGLQCPVDVNETGQMSEAVRLFLRQSVRLGNQAGWNGEEMAAIEQICQHVEGLPRAINLAAEWTDGMSPLYVLEDLQEGDDFLDFLTQEGRHMFEISWQQLAPRFQKILAQLSVFERVFDRHAARFVTGASLPQMARLAEHSLLQQSADGNWRLHRIIKQFAARKLSQQPTDLMEATARLEQYQVAKLNLRGYMTTEIPSSQSLAYFADSEQH